MKGFLLGVLLASLAWGGIFWWQWQRWTAAPDADPEGVVVKADPDAERDRRRVRRRRPARRPPVARGQATAPVSGDDDPTHDPGPMVLSAADTRVVARGDDLSRPDVLVLDMADSRELAELTQDDIDHRFRAREPDILKCIEASRPDTMTYVPGRVTVEFRIRRAGDVRGVRVQAPAILHRGGLHECIRGVVLKLRFPASGGSQVVSYPYQLG